MKKPGQQSLK